MDTGSITLNDRSFVEKALEAAGAKITGAGMGFGGADVSYEHDGKHIMCKIRLMRGGDDDPLPSPLNDPKLN